MIFVCDTAPCSLLLANFYCSLHNIIFEVSFKMKICIFGASSTEVNKNYIEQTERLGERLAKDGHSLVFGGGANGMMGAAARGFKKCGGKITGVAPKFFDQPGILYGECDEFIWNDSMRDRKKWMEDNSDAFIVTPGGIGTYEEFFEVLTLKQLARHAKPIAIFNIDGYYNDLQSLLEKNADEGIVRAQTLSLYHISDDIDDIINYLTTDNIDINTIKYHDFHVKD